MGFSLRSWRQRGAQEDDQVQVSEKAGVRYLHLGSVTVQSAMSLADPLELVLSYTRSMLAFLLFLPEPRDIVLVGLGGASIAKWIHASLPSAVLTAVEVSPQVIACARTHFHLPPDDGRLRVVEGDGAAFVGGLSPGADIIMVDGYDSTALAPQLATEDFYHAAAQALSREGILVANLWSSDRRHQQFLDRIAREFDGQILTLAAAQKGNVIAMGFRKRPLATRWDELRDRARVLEALYGLEFLRFVEALRNANPHTERRLLI